MKRKWFRWVGLVSLVTAIWGGIRLQKSATTWLIERLKTQLPFPADCGPARWSWPVGVVIEDVTIPNLTPTDEPASQGPYFATIKEITLQAPLWGLFFRPLPVEVKAKNPHFMLNLGNLNMVQDLFFQRTTGTGMLQMGSKPPVVPKTDEDSDSDEEHEPAPEKKQSSGPPQAALVGLRVTDGRVDFTDPQIYSDKPLLTLGHLSISARLASLTKNPIIELKSEGTFLSAAGEPVGRASAESTAEFGSGNMRGRMKIWYDRLKDLSLIYFYAPQPFFFAGGAGGPIIEWEIKHGRDVSVSMRSITQDLSIEGMVGDIPWDDILKTAEIVQGRLDITVTAQGRLDDPKFDIHDRLLSELDWAFKERCAARGLSIPTRIFFGLEKPPTENDEEEEFAPVSDEEE